jgi:hypothetical protein
MMRAQRKPIAALIRLVLDDRGCMLSHQFSQIFKAREEQRQGKTGRALPVTFSITEY